jgi:hypothetical protein
MAVKDPAQLTEAIARTQTTLREALDELQEAAIAVAPEPSETAGTTTVGDLAERFGRRRTPRWPSSRRSTTFSAIARSA